MRINRFLADNSSLSRRAADEAIKSGRVLVDGQLATLGQEISRSNQVKLDGQPIATIQKDKQSIILNKPTGYIVSRNGQGGSTIYDLLPDEYQSLNPVGRLDKNSSGLLIMTNDGDLAQRLSHPSYHKLKIYEVRLDKDLEPLHRQMISERGILLEDGPSKLGLNRLQDNDNSSWIVSMSEGRNRQIRRTFDALGYKVTRLHRTQLGNYHLGQLAPGKTKPL